MKVDGSARHSLTHGLGHAFGPSWSPDGSKILFEAGHKSEFYVMDRDGMNTRKMFGCEEVAAEFPGTETWRLHQGHTWLPDSKTVAFLVGKWPYSSKVYLVDSITRQRTVLPMPDSIWNPVWSPDGMKIAFRRRDEKGGTHRQFQLWIANYDGTNQKAVYLDYDVGPPSWLMDSKTIAFAILPKWPAKATLWLKHDDNGGFSQTEIPLPGRPAFVPSIVVAQEGNKLAVATRSPYSIAIFEIRGNSCRHVVTLDDSTDPTWSPDGTHILFVSPIDKRMYIAKADGTGREKVRGQSEGDEESPDWSSPFSSISEGVATTAAHDSLEEKASAAGTHTTNPTTEPATAAGSAVIAPTQKDRSPKDAYKEAKNERRFWHSAEGDYKCEAEFVKLVGDKVNLRKADGATIEVPIDKLSENDREFIAELQRRKTK